jgi:hypothetical protein
MGTPDGSVGPKCIVVWRHRRGGSQNGGGAHHFYTGKKRDKNSESLPTIGNGMDIHALMSVLMPHFRKRLEAGLEGQSEALDNQKMNADLARLPSKPDESLS